MKRKKKGYDIGGYADEIFTQPFEDTREERLDAIFHKNVSHYRVKTIISGPIVESEIYPVYDKKSYAPPKPKNKTGSSRAQRNLNDKNAKKRVVRLINANFTENDIWGTFTYDEAHLPANEEAAQKEMQKYIKRLKDYCKKNDLPELKYIYVTEFNTDKTKGGKIRIHHHIIMNFHDRDIAEKLWKNGGRKNTRRLQPDDFYLEGLARYLVKDPNGKKRWSSSLNLTKPQVYVADRKFNSIRAVEKMINPVLAKEKMRKLYPKFIPLEETKVFTNDQYGGYYFYTRMRRCE